MGFEDFGPAGSVRLGREVEFQGLETVVVVDAVGEEVVVAGFAAADEIHLVKVMQVC